WRQRRHRQLHLRGPGDDRHARLGRGARGAPREAHRQLSHHDGGPSPSRGWRAAVVVSGCASFHTHLPRDPGFGVGAAPYCGTSTRTPAGGTAVTTGLRLHGTPVVPGTGYGPALRAAPRPAIPPVASELPEPAREAERERFRSEERRVGKECRARWSADH